NNNNPRFGAGTRLTVKPSK
uniref:Uncharacterized protein n=1 Tax=Rhinolophus ferrumequinum TaxID=59479 RepID=A0A671DR82_RHIFE